MSFFGSKARRTKTRGLGDEISILTREEVRSILQYPDCEVRYASESTALEENFWVEVMSRDGDFELASLQSEGAYNYVKSLYATYREVINDYGHSFTLYKNDVPLAVLPCCRLKILYKINPTLFRRLIELEANLTHSDSESSKFRYIVESTFSNLFSENESICLMLFYISLDGKIHRELFDAVKKVYKHQKRLLSVNGKEEAKVFMNSGFKRLKVTPTYYLLE